MEKSFDSECNDTFVTTNNKGKELLLNKLCVTSQVIHETRHTSCLTPCNHQLLVHINDSYSTVFENEL